MNGEPWYRRVMNGRGGPLAGPMRGLLYAASLGYGLVVARRNAYFDRRERQISLTVPVFSVGNVTVGGTGKTPLVMDLVERLNAMGRSPAVVARGYGGGDEGPNDEQRLIQRRCPGVIYVADRDRVEAGRLAVEEYGADVVVLDDGFQHRRLARDLDIVLIDATCPFGYGHLLPRGLLREPPTALGRAGLIVLTRCDQAPMGELRRIEARLRVYAPDAAILKCRHHVTSIHRLSGEAEPSDLAGRRAVVFGGIANPGSFLTTVSSLGANVVGERWWPDHHHYVAKDVTYLNRAGRFPPFDVLVTTEKDAVKLSAIPEASALPILVVRIAVAFEEDSGVVFQRKIEDVVRGRSFR